MRRTTLIPALLLCVTIFAPAFAFSCDNPCKAGEVYSFEADLRVPAPKPVR